MTIGELGWRGRVGYPLAITIGAVENCSLASVISVAPLTALIPAGTVTASSVACGSRGIAVNVATRVSIQRHVPATAGVIVATGPTGVPTAATGTIGSENR